MTYPLQDTLTDRQQEILDYISSYADVHGIGPTVRELGEHFGIKSPNGVMAHLKALEKKRRIERRPRRQARSIVVVHACGYSINTHNGRIVVRSGFMTVQQARDLAQELEAVAESLTPRVSFGTPGANHADHESHEGQHQEP